MTKPRKGQFEGMFSREEFRARFHGSFDRPSFKNVQ
jgi:hypothetical protein